jgi:HAD superfamily hydrolase (TIGR01509 family)
VDRAVNGLATASGLPEVAAAERTEDCSAELNRAAEMLRFERAGFDDELAEALYALDFKPASHPVFPDVAGVLAAIRSQGVRMALVSDIHFDLRVDLEANGLGGNMDVHVLSFEHGFQKPDPRMFRLALDGLGAMPSEALMVGDRASHDGGAASIGIDTLILPAPKAMGPRGLDVVLRLLG